MAASAPLIEWLHAATDRINLLDLPVRRVLGVDGIGEPRGIVFMESADALRTLLHEMSIRHQSRPEDRPASAHLEALWWLENDPDRGHAAESGEVPVRLDHARQANPDRSLHWRLLVELPARIADDEALEAASRARTERHDRLGIDRIELAELHEGRCAQILHIGTFASETPTLDRLDTGVSNEGYRLVGPHHEIYLTDVRLSEPARWRRIIRYPVDRIEGFAAIGAPAEIVVS
jgi:hypothetical protein